MTNSDSLLKALRDMNFDASGPYSREELTRLLTMSYDSGGYERSEVEAFEHAISGCNRFIDIGANVGQYTLAAAQRMTGGDIVSIEANPFLMPILNTLGEYLNNSRQNRISTTNAAVTDQDGPVVFHLSVAANCSSLQDGVRLPMTTAVTVQGVSLDTFFEASRQTLIKIDVEGSEYRVLTSGKRFLASDNTTFFVELHGWGDSSIGKYPLDVCKLMRRNGFAMRHVGRWTSNHFVFYKAGAVERAASYVAIVPRLAPISIIYKYAKAAVPRLRKIRGRVAGLIGESTR